MKQSGTEEYWYGQVRKGLLEYAVFSVLTSGENYGYAILQELRSYPSMTKVTESAVYPILARSVKEGYISAHSVKSASGPPRKYFELQAKGRIKLAFMQKFVNSLQKDLKKLNADYEPKK
ncbi:PadR family transcriptional regulator [Persicirhabdus sediminis]|uniref:PadR family transcriptional regulator n=1 Tax=Persicirhabdus sediminis TaxID=454144 RepID=A0A8J7MEX0_9BACT|nr:PadR family transcriptional regulator [Persicirhabdus sediminis]MBK1792122.1 PadR family transcriptional regulator [Persicirhabdus sediminis]